MNLLYSYLAAFKLRVFIPVRLIMKGVLGKTQNRVMDRFIGHRADLRRSDYIKPAYHFKQEGHMDEDMGVINIEEVKGKDDTYRITKERF